MFAFNFAVSSTDLSIRLGRFEVFAIRGSGRVPSEGGDKYPGEVAFDLLGATVYLSNHHRTAAHYATLSARVYP